MWARRYACYFLGPFHTADVHRHRARAPLDLFPWRRRFLINHGRQSQVARNLRVAPSVRRPLDRCFSTALRLRFVEGRRSIEIVPLPFSLPFFGRFVNQSKSKQGKCFDNENRFNPLTVRPCPLGSLRFDLANSRIRSHDAIHLQNIK